MDQSFKLNVPNRKFVLVEYPGRVKNVDRALKTLGGEKAVANVGGFFLFFILYLLSSYL